MKPVMNSDMNSIRSALCNYCPEQLLSTTILSSSPFSISVHQGTWHKPPVNILPTVLSIKRFRCIFLMKPPVESLISDHAMCAFKVTLTCLTRFRWKIDITTLDVNFCSLWVRPMYGLAWYQFQRKTVATVFNATVAWPVWRYWTNLATRITKKIFCHAFWWLTYTDPLIFQFETLRVHHF